MADLFYSEVYETVQNEIAARGIAGTFSRTTKDLDFMLGKIANVSLYAHKVHDLEVITPFFEIGGFKMREGGFLPTGPDGYLNNNAYRTPPYISSATTTIADNTRGFLNKATINIRIPDPADIDDFELVWCRPGRKVELTIQYPESAVLGGKFEIIPTETQVIAHDSGSATLHTVDFEGLIVGFEWNQLPDASYEATLHITGTSNIYTELSMKSFEQTATQEGKTAAAEKKLSFGTTQGFSSLATVGSTNAFKSEPASLTVARKLANSSPNVIKSVTAENFYTILNSEFDTVIKQKASEAGEEHLTDVKEAGQVASGWLWGNLYQRRDAPKEQKSSDDATRYISLGQLISFINIRYTSISPGDEILIWDSKSNPWPLLKSADPTRVLLWQGVSSNKTSTYKLENPDDGIGGVVEILHNVPQSQRSSGYLPSGATHSNTQEIYIAMSVIESIILEGAKKERYSIKDFLNQVGGEVLFQTGGAVNLKLTSPPMVGNKKLGYTLWTDVNFIGDVTSKKTTTMFKIPMFANSAGGTVVEDFKISAQLPDSARNLAFVLNEDPELISESEVAPYVSYMYADETLKDAMRNNWTTKHTNAKDALDRAEKEIAKSKFENEDEQTSYRSAIAHFLQYPMDTINESSLIGRPIFDISANLTLDGINGFKYGDVLQIEGIPERYNKYAVFCIVAVTHTVDPTGKWITNLNTIMRVRVDDK